MSQPLPEVLLEQWLYDLASDDRAPGTIRRYKSAITSFLAWYAEVERRPLALDHLSAIVLVGYRTFLQQTQGRSTSTVSGHVSALRAWCAWLVERRHLEANPARGGKLPRSGEGWGQTRSMRCCAR
jgi:site-specific recombinase XerC